MTLAVGLIGSSCLLFPEYPSIVRRVFRVFYGKLRRCAVGAWLESGQMLCDGITHGGGAHGGCYVLG